MVAGFWTLDLEAGTVAPMISVVPRWVVSSPWFLGLSLAAATVLAYSVAIQGDFIWDDDNYVTANATLHDLNGLWRIWFEPRATPQYYPLTFTSLWIEYQLWGLDPFGFHVTNVLLHVLNAALFGLLLKRLAVPGAWFAAAIFALHPIHVESVAWITERKNVLSGACYLAAALAYLRYAPPESNGHGLWGWYVAALALFVGALLSKTVTCSLPAALLLVYFWKHGRLDLRHVIPLLPFFLVGLVGAVTTVWLERDHVGAQGADWEFSIVERCLLAGRILWFYLWTLVWPLNLTFIYPRWQIDSAVWWQYAFPAAALMAVAALAIFRRRIGNGPIVAALFYAGTLVPALGFFNVYPMRYSFVADHFAYLATLGPIAVFTALAERAVSLFSLRAGLRRSGAAAILLVLGFLTWKQGHVYLGPEELWSDTVAKNPSNWAVRVNLGGVYADRGRIDEAIANMELAIELWPSAPEPYNALGAMWEQQGEFERAEALFREALRIEPRYYEAHTNVGLVSIELGNYDSALSNLRAAMLLKPEYVEGHYYAGRALALLGRHAEAAKHYADALLIVPHHADAHNGLCGVLLEQGRIPDALRHCKEALRLKSDFPEAHENAARALRIVGRASEASEQDRIAMEIRTRRAALHREFALQIAGDGRPRAAIAHLIEALRFDPEDGAVRMHLQRLRDELS